MSHFSGNGLKLGDDILHNWELRDSWISANTWALIKSEQLDSSKNLGITRLNFEPCCNCVKDRSMDEQNP